MARIDTLTNFLTDVADSIRSKTGKSEAIACEDFDTEIESISGGGEPNLQTKSVTIDEEGTYTITADSGYEGLASVTVTVEKGLPYEELEYIESNTDINQYLATNYKLNSNTRVIAKVSRDTSIQKGTSYTGSFFGVYTGGSTNYMIGYRVKNSNSNRLEIYYGNQTQTLSITNNDLILDFDKNVWNVYDFNSTLLGTKTFNTATFTSPYNTLIMANKLNQDAASQMQFCRLYYLKIYDNGQLIYDIIPVLSKDGTVCAYNKVDDTFMYNHGTGSFVAGPKI